jgi:hypothetical protein
MLRLMLKSLFLLLPITTFAFNCPTVNNTIEPGSSYEQVVIYCGQPSGLNAFTKSNIDAEEWFYFKTLENHEKVKLTLLFNYGELQNINLASNPKNCGTLVDGEPAPCPLAEQNVSDTDICGKMIQPGQNTQLVKAICGAPAGQHALKTRAVPVMELMYRTRTGQVKVVLENNELTAIQPA